MKFDTLKEQHAKRNPEDLEIDFGMQSTCQYSISPKTCLQELGLDMLACLLVYTSISVYYLKLWIQFFYLVLSEDQFQLEDEDIPYQEDPVSYDSDVIETAAIDDDNEEEEEEEEEEGDEETTNADLGSGWGRIIFTPVRRGKQVAMDVCRATNREGSEGSFDRVVITQSKNPTLHRQARRSLWGDLWPF